MCVKILPSLLRYSTKLEEHSLTESNLATAFLDWFHKALNIFNAADSWFEASGRGEIEYKECKGKQTWAWKSGYSAVLDLLMVRQSQFAKLNHHRAIKRQN
jgi:hypothetical protein